MRVNRNFRYRNKKILNPAALFFMPVLQSCIVINYGKGWSPFKPTSYFHILIFWCQFMRSVSLHFVTRMEPGMAPRHTASLPQALGPGPKTSSCNSLKTLTSFVFHGKKIKKQFTNIVTLWNADTIKKIVRYKMYLYLDIVVFAIFPQFTSPSRPPTVISYIKRLRELAN